MLSNRTFGVEIECGHPELSYTEMATQMQENGFHAGFYEAGRKTYGVDRDGSGLEIKTPILKGEKGYRELERIMTFLKDQGCFVTRRDGMHVHVGAASFESDEKACAIIARSWYNNQQVIGRMCSSHRTGHGMCARLTQSELKTLGQTVHKDYWGRGYKEWGDRKSLNLEPVPEYGTIEFRLHEGCLDPVKAIAWVKFCQKFVDYAYRERKVLSCAKSKTALLTTLGVPQDALAVLTKRQPLMPVRRRV